MNIKSHFQFHPWEKIINGEVVDYDAPVEEDVIMANNETKDDKVEEEEDKRDTDSTLISTNDNL